MRMIDLSFDAPEMNLALDEVLLDSAESGRGPSTLRFWESPRPFVVLGTGQALSEEAVEAHCVADGVPILRRCSAGGCVLQGPGSLNYALALRFDDYPEVRSLGASYRFILGRISEAFTAHGLAVRQEGISDLAMGGRKISGNAQRRRRRAILHHGTLLYQADGTAMARYLAEPEDRPDYRGSRGHGDFVAVLPLSADVIRAAIRTAFGLTEKGEMPTEEERNAAQTLAKEKYADDEWTRRR